MSHCGLGAVQALVDLLSHSDTQLADAAATALSKTPLVYDTFHDVLELSQSWSISGDNSVGRYCDRRSVISAETLILDPIFTRNSFLPIL